MACRRGLAAAIAIAAARPGLALGALVWSASDLSEPRPAEAPLPHALGEDASPSVSPDGRTGCALLSYREGARESGHAAVGRQRRRPSPPAGTIPPFSPRRLVAPVPFDDRARLDAALPDSRPWGRCSPRGSSRRVRAPHSRPTDAALRSAATGGQGPERSGISICPRRRGRCEEVARLRGESHVADICGSPRTGSRSPSPGGTSTLRAPARRSVRRGGTSCDELEPTRAPGLIVISVGLPPGAATSSTAQAEVSSVGSSDRSGAPVFSSSGSGPVTSARLSGFRGLESGRIVRGRGGRSCRILGVEPLRQTCGKSRSRLRARREDRAAG